MKSNDKTSTYMRLPNQWGVWAQRTSGKMKLGTGNKRVVEWTEEGGRDTTIKIKSDITDRRTPTDKTSLGRFWLRRSREA